MLLASTLGGPGASLDASALGFDVPSSPTVPNICSFNGLTGGPGLFTWALGPFRGLPTD